MPDFILKVTDTKQSNFYKNATNTVDYGTVIQDKTENTITTLTIQNGKLILAKQVDGVITGTITVAEIT